MSIFIRIYLQTIDLAMSGRRLCSDFFGQPSSGNEISDTLLAMDNPYLSSEYSAIEYKAHGD
jgi:hypothetical protein